MAVHVMVSSQGGVSQVQGNVFFFFTVESMSKAHMSLSVRSDDDQSPFQLVMAVHDSQSWG